MKDDKKYQKKKTRLTLIFGIILGLFVTALFEGVIRWLVAVAVSSLLIYYIINETKKNE